MAQKLDYKQLGKDIVRLVGGPKNVKSLGHCMTRLRFVLFDDSKADGDAIKKLNGVLGVAVAGGQFMVIMGQNLLSTFDAINQQYVFGGDSDGGSAEAPKEKEPMSVRKVGSAVLGYVSASITPLIPGLVAGGMLKVILLLISLAVPSFSDSTTYIILSGVADSAFYFMAIFVSYGAAVKLGGTPIFAMVCTAAMLHGNYVDLLNAGDPVHLIFLPVKLVKYSSQLLPALLIALAAYYVEKLLNKIVPGIFKSLLVGLGTIFITSTLGFVVLGPLGSLIGSYLSLIFVFIGNYAAPLALGLLAACLPWMVMCGMHSSTVPMMTQALVDPGYDSIFRPALILHNMAEGGACLGVALRTKDKEFRSEAIGIAFGCIVAGVTEPAVYGINLRLRKPMYGVMAGGAVGGVVAGLLGVRVYMMGYSTILALPIFEETMFQMLIAIVIAIVVAAAVAFILGFEEEATAAPASDENANGSAEESDSQVLLSAEDSKIVAVADGKMIPINTVHDETFAAKMLGDGVAFELDEDAKTVTIAAPRTGNLSVLAETGHAFGISCADGVELLVHVGIDTVEMNGVGFTALAKAGDDVHAGDSIIRADVEMLRKQGYDMTTMLVITDDNGKEIAFKEYGDYKKGETVSVQ